MLVEKTLSSLFIVCDCVTVSHSLLCGCVIVWNPSTPTHGQDFPKWLFETKKPSDFYSLWGCWPKTFRSPSARLSSWTRHSLLPLIPLSLVVWGLLIASLRLCDCVRAHVLIPVCDVWLVHSVFTLQQDNHDPLCAVHTHMGGVVGGREAFTGAAKLFFKGLWFFQ